MRAERENFDRVELYMPAFIKDAQLYAEASLPFSDNWRKGAGSITSELLYAAAGYLTYAFDDKMIDEIARVKIADLTIDVLIPKDAWRFFLNLPDRDGIRSGLLRQYSLNTDCLKGIWVVAALEIFGTSKEYSRDKFYEKIPDAKYIGLLAGHIFSKPKRNALLHDALELAAKRYRFADIEYRQNNGEDISIDVVYDKSYFPKPKYLRL